MKVSLGRPVKVNNFLTTLNITLIANRNLKKMKARAGEAIKKISTASSNKAAIDAYEKEMEFLNRQKMHNMDIFMRPLFRHYYKGTDAVVVVVDAADKERIEELFCDVLKPALHAEELAHSVFLFLVNKRDLRNTMTSEEVASRLSLKFKKHKWHIIETSALRGDGLTESMEWLAAELGPTSGHPHRKHSTKNSPQHSAHANDAKHGVTNDVSNCDRNFPPPTRSTYGQVLSNRKHTAKCSPLHNTSDTNGDIRNDVMSCSVVSKEISPTRDYCNRAYSAFRCFFIRPSVPPEVDDDDSDLLLVIGIDLG